MAITKQKKILQLGKISFFQDVFDFKEFANI